MKKRTIIPFAACLILITACKGKKADPGSRRNSPTLVDVIIAGPRTITTTVEANGTVLANEFVELRPEVSGRLIYLNIPEGKYVSQGTVLARVNDADLKAQLEKSKVQLDLAQKTEARYKQLLEVNGLNQSDYDLVLNQLNGYKADIAYTQALIDKTVIRAPFSGTVGLRQVSPGAFVTSATVIATMQQVNKTKIDFTVPEEYNKIIRPGTTVDVEPDAGQAVRRKALITAVEPQVNQATRNLKVRAVLQNGNDNPGSFVKVYISSKVDNNAILVPTNCIIPEDKNKQLVLVKNGKAAFVSVETGVREASNIEITKGVQPGDSVVVTGVLFARPKAALKVRSVKSLDDLTNNQ
ncbi:MAG TPA: efflux RND transporter periplasmic adaptor subunit [Chitinophagaceae bacterium]|nr:efflux RND transporter periplasmic adaptor subunit [Chitinophagaceae bacterium]